MNRVFDGLVSKLIEHFFLVDTLYSDCVGHRVYIGHYARFCWYELNAQLMDEY